MASEPLGAYVHLPYCPYKCHYCDFNAYRLPRAEGAVREMTEAIVREIERAPGPDRGREAGSVYFGGGTPSIFPPQAVAAILDALSRRYRLSPRAEVTLEANPGTLDRTALAALRRHGVNRLSLGAQSFSRATLQRLGRGHGPKETVQAFRQARQAGFRNVSLDIIYGLPGESVQSTLRSVRQALSLQPDHLSAYALEVEEKTAFGHWARDGRLQLPSDEEVVRAGDAIAEMCRQSGLARYEVSNFARPRRRSRHNLLYWYQGDYRGFGPGAHSHASGHRFWNESSPGGYLRMVRERGEAVAGEERLSPRAAMGEWVYLRLRLEEGVSLEAFRRRFGVRLQAAYPGVLESLRADGLVLASGHRILPTPRGRWLLHRVAEPFIT